MGILDTGSCYKNVTNIYLHVTKTASRYNKQTQMWRDVLTFGRGWRKTTTFELQSGHQQWAVEICPVSASRLTSAAELLLAPLAPKAQTRRAHLSKPTESSAGFTCKTTTLLPEVTSKKNCFFKFPFYIAKSGIHCNLESLLCKWVGGWCYTCVWSSDWSLVQSFQAMT